MGYFKWLVLTCLRAKIDNYRHFKVLPCHVRYAYFFVVVPLVRYYFLESRYFIKFIVVKFNIFNYLWHKFILIWICYPDKSSPLVLYYISRFWVIRLRIYFIVIAYLKLNVDLFCYFFKCFQSFLLVRVPFWEIIMFKFHVVFLIDVIEAIVLLVLFSSTHRTT